MNGLRDNIPNGFPSPSHQPHSHGPHPNFVVPTNNNVLTRMKKSSASFTATFVGLSGYPDEIGVFTSSPLVEIDNKLWTVRLYPGGIDEESRGHLSCYVTYESRGRIRASHKITLLNQMGWKHHAYVSDGVKTFINQSEDPEDCQNVWGDDKFLSHLLLRNAPNGHCVDDTIIIRVDLMIYGEMEQTVSKAWLSAPLLTPARAASASLPHLLGPAVSFAKEAKDASSPEQRSILDDLSAILFDVNTADVFFHVVSSRTRTRATRNTTTRSHYANQLEHNANAEKLMIEVSTPPRTALADNNDEEDKDVDDNDSDDAIEEQQEEEEEEITIIPAHKFVLCLRSEVFRMMLSGPNSHSSNNATSMIYAEGQTGKIVIEDFSPAAIRLMLRYMYTDSCITATVIATTNGQSILQASSASPSDEINNNNNFTLFQSYAEEVLAIACKYHLSGLEIQCIAYLCNTLTCQNVAHILSLADLLGAKELKERAMSFIVANAARVLNNNEEGVFFEHVSYALCQEIMKKMTAAL